MCNQNHTAFVSYPECWVNRFHTCNAGWLSLAAAVTGNNRASSDVECEQEEHSENVCYEENGETICTLVYYDVLVCHVN